MSDQAPEKDTVRYTCDVCGYENHWTRAEILRKGRQTLYLDDQQADVYALSCRNPALRCSGRWKVAVPRREP